MCTLKECQVVILSTEEKSNIFKTKYGLSCSFPQIEQTKNSDNQHLSILSDDKIKEGDWYYDFYTKQVFKCRDLKYQEEHKYLHKKIIATTDKYLGWSNIGQDESGVTIGNHKIKGNGCTFKPDSPEPSKGFIKKYCEVGGIDKILVEYEDVFEGNKPFQKYLGQRPKVSADNTITIKPIKNSYTKEEVLSLCKDAYNTGEESGLGDFRNDCEIISFENWSIRNL